MSKSDILINMKRESSLLTRGVACLWVSGAMAVCALSPVDAAEWITGSYVVPPEDDYAAHFADAPNPVLKREFALAAKPVHQQPRESASQYSRPLLSTRRGRA